MATADAPVLPALSTVGFLADGLLLLRSSSLLLQFYARAWAQASVGRPLPPAKGGLRGPKAQALAGFRFSFLPEQRGRLFGARRA